MTKALTFSNIYRLQAECDNSCSTKIFNNMNYSSKIVEAMYINWEKPALNQQIYHVNSSLSFQFICTFFLHLTVLNFMYLIRVMQVILGNT